jgi:hypothetical protein
MLTDALLQLVRLPLGFPRRVSAGPRREQVRRGSLDEVIGLTVSLVFVSSHVPLPPPHPPCLYLVGAFSLSLSRARVGRTGYRARRSFCSASAPGRRSAPAAGIAAPTGFLSAGGRSPPTLSLPTSAGAATAAASCRPARCSVDWQWLAGSAWWAWPAAPCR